MLEVALGQHLDIMAEQEGRWIPGAFLNVALQVAHLFRRCVRPARRGLRSNSTHHQRTPTDALDAILAPWGWPSSCATTSASSGTQQSPASQPGTTCAGKRASCLPDLGGLLPRRAQLSQEHAQGWGSADESQSRHESWRNGRSAHGLVASSQGHHHLP